MVNVRYRLTASSDVSFRFARYLQPWKCGKVRKNTTFPFLASRSPIANLARLLRRVSPHSLKIQANECPILTIAVGHPRNILVVHLDGMLPLIRRRGDEMRTEIARVSLNQKRPTFSKWRRGRLFVIGLLLIASAII